MGHRDNYSAGGFLCAALRMQGLAGLIVVLLAACDKPSQDQPPRPEAVVKIAQALRQEITEWDEYTGRIEAVEAVEVRARGGGLLQKVNFAAGALVKPGDLLFEIDPKPFEAQLDYATAELERAKIKHELAKNDLVRAENLFEAKAISIEEYDARQKGLRETAAAVTSAEATVHAAKLNLDYTAIKAPIGGRIGREMVTAGNLIKSGGDGTLLTHIVSTDKVYVYVDADERSVLKYRRRARQPGQGAGDWQGTPVQLALADEAEFPHQGRLDYVAPQANAATGTVTLRGVFANADELLSPGFFARMRVRASDPYPATLLPDRAIGSDQAESFVWIVKPDNQLDYRRVELGPLIGSMRVVRAGLKADDWVVVEGGQKLRPGSSVKPERIVLDARGIK
ncbi:MAG: efflux RND transporter periplasmic adaptor subunit [Methylomonas sp.]|nr:efflux RND transporter periplasmic adaptor subunit [Methylomonas sp.]